MVRVSSAASVNPSSSSRTLRAFAGGDAIVVRGVIRLFVLAFRLWAIHWTVSGSVEAVQGAIAYFGHPQFWVREIDSNLARGLLNVMSGVCLFAIAPTLCRLMVPENLAGSGWALVRQFETERTVIVVSGLYFLGEGLVDIAGVLVGVLFQTEAEHYPSDLNLRAGIVRLVNAILFIPACQWLHHRCLKSPSNLTAHSP